MRRLGRAPVVLALLLALAGCGASGDGVAGGGQGSSSGSDQPASPPPTPDPRAGRPAYVAGIGEEDRHALLDETGRVVRVLRGEASVPCPGGRNLVSTGAWSGRVEARTLGGRLIWRRRIPLGGLHGFACLDRRARRMAVVLDNQRNAKLALHVVSRRRSRRVMRFDGQTPLVTSDRLFVTDDGGLRIHRLPSARLVRRVPGPVGIYQVLAAPGGRHLAFASLPPNADEGFWLGEVGGDFRRIRIPRVRLLGWLSATRLAVRADRRLRVLDTNLREVAAVDGFRPTEGLVVDGAVVAIDGTTLIRARPGMTTPERIGSVPAGARLIARIDAE